MWFEDLNGNGGFCAARVPKFNEWCNRADAQYHVGTGRPMCWMRLPSGCATELSETQKPTCTRYAIWLPSGMAASGMAGFLSQGSLSQGSRGNWGLEIDHEASQGKIPFPRYICVRMYPDRLSTMGKSAHVINYPKYTLRPTDRQ